MSVSVRTHHYRTTPAKPLLFPYQILYQALYLGSLFKPRGRARQTLHAPTRRPVNVSNAPGLSPS